jgi:hypothetical protein
MATPSLLLIPDRYKSGVLYSQLPESGAGDLTFTRASGATRVNASGLIESVASGVPRLDYTGGGCPSLLLEPQRTNLFLNSASGATQSITVTAAAHTLSFYNTGSVTLSDVASGTLVGVGTGVANRVSLTFTPTAGTLTLTVSGTITDVQLEEGSYPTSYIPTTSAAVTRAADAASKTGISSLIGQTEGTIFWEGTINGIPVDQTIFGVEKEASSFVIRFGGDGTNLYAQAFDGSTNLFFQTTTPSVGQKIKLAFAYKAGDYAFYKNGTLVASGTDASTIPACDKLQTNQLWSTAGGIGAYGTNAAAIYPVRLSNTELAALTAL